MSAEAKADLFAIIDAVPGAYQHVRLAILQGRIAPIYPNVTLGMKLGCLKAHVADYLHCDSWDSPGAAKKKIRVVGSGETLSPVESYAYNRVFGFQTPQTCEALKNILAWLDEWHLRQTEGGVEPEESVGQIEEDF